jgi:hypothetical protein
MENQYRYIFGRPSVEMSLVQDCAVLAEFAVATNAAAVMVWDISSEVWCCAPAYQPNLLCSVERLVLVDLTGFPLSGTVPASFALLTGLVGLSLSQTDLGGSLDAFANLSLLTVLDLSSNHFTGPLSPLGSLSRLGKLYLSSNQLTGPLDALAPLAQVEELWLNHNLLTGSLGPAFNRLPLLRVALLASNALTGPLQLPPLPSLIQLVARDNFLCGSLTSLSGYPPPPSHPNI